MLEPRGCWGPSSQSADKTNGQQDGEYGRQCHADEAQGDPQIAKHQQPELPYTFGQDSRRNLQKGSGPGKQGPQQAHLGEGEAQVFFNGGQQRHQQSKGQIAPDVHQRGEHQHSP